MTSQDSQTGEWQRQVFQHTVQCSFTISEMCSFWGPTIIYVYMCQDHIQLLHFHHPHPHFIVYLFFPKTIWICIKKPTVLGLFTVLFFSSTTEIQ